MTAAIAGSTAAMLVSSGSALADPPPASYLVISADASNTSAAAFTATDASNPPGPYADASVTFDLLKTDVNLNPTPDGPYTTSVALDSLCDTALQHGVSYAITATSANTTVATVNPPQSDHLKCPLDTTRSFKNYPTKAAFTVTPVGCGLDANGDPADGTTTVLFNPIAATNGGSDPNGQQKKVGSSTLDVTVLDNCGSNPPVPPGTGNRPAAPAVTNAYLNANRGDTLWNNCKTVYAKKYGNLETNWRGGLVSEIANSWMPLPESLKDNTDYFPLDNDWIQYVRSEVRHKCTGKGVNSVTLEYDWNPLTADNGGPVPVLLNGGVFWKSDGGLAPNYTGLPPYYAP